MNFKNLVLLVMNFFLILIRYVTNFRSSKLMTNDQFIPATPTRLKLINSKRVRVKCVEINVFGLQILDQNPSAFVGYSLHTHDADVTQLDS